MFCNKCGQQLPDDAKFCGNCGNAFASQQEVNLNSVHAPNNVNNVHNTSANKNKNLILILSITAGALFVVLLIIVVVVFVLNGQNSQNGSENTEIVEQEEVYKNPKTELKTRVKESATNKKGYKLQTEIKTTDWLKGTDIDAIQEKWDEICSWDLPTEHDFNTFAQIKDHPTSYNNCLILLGTFNFTNLTPEISDMDSTGLNIVRARLKIEDGLPDYTRRYKAVYNKYDDSAGYFHYDSLWSNGYTTAELVDGKMKKNSYGPSPFMIIVQDVIDPSTGKVTVDVNTILMKVFIEAVTYSDPIGGDSNKLFYTFKAGQSW